MIRAIKGCPVLNVGGRPAPSPPRPLINKNGRRIMEERRIVSSSGSEKYAEEQRKNELNRAAKELSECRSFVVITSKEHGGSAISAVDGDDLIDMSISCLKMAFELKRTITKIGEIDEKKDA
jgi:hypothetical protein